MKFIADGLVHPYTISIQVPSSVFAIKLKLSASASVQPFTTATQLPSLTLANGS